MSSGTFRANFMLKTNSGLIIGMGQDKAKPFWVEIIVQESSTSLDFIKSACSAEWVSSAGALPCFGRDEDPQGFVLKLNDPQIEGVFTSDLTALLTQPEKIRNGYIIGTFPAYRVKYGDHFLATVGCEKEATDCFVVFRLDYQKDEVLQTFWATAIDIQGVASQGVDLDLTPLAGQDIAFSLSVFSVGSADGDRAIWVNPRIEHQVTPSYKGWRNPFTEQER